MQDVRSMASINPYAGEKEHFGLLTVYLWPSYIQLYLTITKRNTQGIPLPSPLGEGLGVRPIGAGGEASWGRGRLGLRPVGFEFVSPNEQGSDETNCFIAALQCR